MVRVTGGPGPLLRRPGQGQLLAGMRELRNRNTFGALAFSSYGAFWLAFAAYVKFVVPGLPASQVYKAEGLFLLAWTIFAGYMLIASRRVSVAVAAVFLALFVTFLLLTIGVLNQTDSIAHAGGWLGLITAVLAWYACFAGFTNATFKRQIIPTIPLSRTL
jgi:succinate-acetate transporter protein